MAEGTIYRDSPIHPTTIRPSVFAVFAVMFFACNEPADDAGRQAAIEAKLKDPNGFIAKSRKADAERLKEKKKIQAAEQAKVEGKFLKSKAGRLWKQHPDWSREDCRLIADKQVRIGMNREQVLAALGKPEDKNITFTANRTREQWVYFGSSVFVYFDDGVMSAIQTSSR